MERLPGKKSLRSIAALFGYSPAALAACPRIMEVIAGGDASASGPLTTAEKDALQELLKRVVATAREQGVEQKAARASATVSVPADPAGAPEQCRGQCAPGHIPFPRACAGKK